MVILLDTFSDRLSQTIRPPTCFISSLLPDVESLAREMKVLCLLCEVCSSFQLIPAHANHLQALSPFHCLDIAAESIKESLMRLDNVSLWA